MPQSNVGLGDDEILKRTIGRWEFPHSLSYGLERGSGVSAPWYGTTPATGATCGDINIGGTGWSSDGCCFIFMNHNGTVTPLSYTSQVADTDKLRHLFSAVGGTPPVSVAATYSGLAVKVGDYSKYIGTVASAGVNPTFNGNLKYASGTEGNAQLVGNTFNNISVTTDGTKTLGELATTFGFSIISTASPLTNGTVLDAQTFNLSGGSAPGTTGTISLRSIEKGLTDDPASITGDGTSTVSQLVATYMATDPIEPIEVISGGSEIPGNGQIIELDLGVSTSRVQVSLTAQTAGSGGNQISLRGDNVKTLTQLAADWNTANTTNQVTVNSGGSNILADYDGEEERNPSGNDYVTIRLSGGVSSFGIAHPYVFFAANEQHSDYPVITEADADKRRSGMRVHPHDNKLVTILWRAPWSGKIDLSFVLGHYHGTSQKTVDNEEYGFAYWTHDPSATINPGTYTTNTRTNYLDWTETQLGEELENFTSATGSPTGKRHNITGMSGYSGGSLAGSVGDIRGGYKNITFTADPMTKKESATSLQVTRGDIIEITLGTKSNTTYGMIDVQGHIQYQNGIDSIYGFKKHPVKLSRVVARMHAQTCLTESSALDKEDLTVSSLKNSDNTNRQTPIKTRITGITTGNINGGGTDNGSISAEVIDKADQTEVYMRLLRAYGSSPSSSPTNPSGGWIDMSGKTSHTWTGLNGGSYVLMVKSTQCKQIQNHSLFIDSLYDYL